MEPSGLFSREGLEARRRALERFAAWEREQPPAPARENVLSDLDALFRLLDPAPPGPRRPSDYEGVAILHAALAVLDGEP
ncbi:MAG: hypothetical protein ACOYXN_09955 [Acidobacteriota bacterium]